MLSTADPIVAPATPLGAGGRAIVRIAGDGLPEILAALLDPAAPGLPQPGDQPRLVAARLAADGLGREWGPCPVEVLSWPGPAGPLGQPLAELQLPASGPLVAAVVEEACRRGCRLARGGEFTLRAFLAGRLDLVQAEAVLAVVEARTPDELATALDRMAAGAAGPLAAVRGDVLDLLADVEAAIDFADETIPDSVPAAAIAGDVARRIRLCREAVERVADRLAARGTTAAELPRVVLVGPPNIGKSTLFNAILGREAALVADEHGTTRDWLEGRLETAEGPVCLVIDMAGMRELASPAEGLRASESPAAMGLTATAEASAREVVGRCDVVVVCRDTGTAGIEPAWLPTGIPRLDVVTRADRAATPPAGEAIATSGLTGAGVGLLRNAIVDAVSGLPARGTVATERLAAGCAAARQALAAAEGASGDAAVIAGDEAIVAVALRRAAEALADVTGVTIDTDLLDRIFSRHCIGK